MSRTRFFMFAALAALLGFVGGVYAPLAVPVFPFVLLLPVIAIRGTHRWQQVVAFGVSMGAVAATAFGVAIFGVFLPSDTTGYGPDLARVMSMSIVSMLLFFAFFAVANVVIGLVIRAIRSWIGIDADCVDVSP